MLTKLGLKKLKVYDEDGVTAHNLPNQFYRMIDIGNFKVEALHNIIKEFTDTEIETAMAFYVNQPLSETVIVATDSMSSRKLVWKEFLKQTHCKNYIEARMGAELGLVYTIRKGDKGLTTEDWNFYEETLYPDSKVKPAPCTERSIIYTVSMIAGMITRAFKSTIDNVLFPREMIFDMKNMMFMRRD